MRTYGQHTVNLDQKIATVHAL